jgi:hypothetical protein
MCIQNAETPSRRANAQAPAELSAAGRDSQSNLLQAYWALRLNNGASSFSITDLD